MAGGVKIKGCPARRRYARRRKRLARISPSALIFKRERPEGQKTAVPETSRSVRGDYFLTAGAAGAATGAAIAGAAAAGAILLCSSTSRVSVTSSPTSTPPAASSGLFQLRPQSLRLILAVADAPR